MAISGDPNDPITSGGQPGRQVTVVIADDHPIFRDGLRRALTQQKDVRVVGEAADGEAAVRIVLEKKPDLLLLDYALPGFSGLEVMRRLQPRTVSTKVLFLTAAMVRQQVVEALELGARGVLTKDAAAELLTKAMRCVLAGEYWVGREVLADWASYAHRKEPAQPRLTPREQQIVREILSGRTNAEIAAVLDISDDTVKRHIANIYDKLGVSSRMELALLVTRDHLNQR